MTKTESLPPGLHGNLRPLPANRVSTWDDQVLDDVMASESAHWRAADTKDLVALACWGLPVLAAAIAAALA